QRTAIVDGDLASAILVTRGGSNVDVSTALGRAERTLRRFGRFREVAALCARWRDPRCEGDALALQGHFAQAATRYRASLDGGSDHQLLMRLGWATLRAGDHD